MSKPQQGIEELTDEQKDVLRSIRTSRIVLPILIGIGVVAYLFFQNFDAEEFSKTPWSANVWTWVSIAVIILIIRHIAYATRLRILSDKAFSWKKCIELIFIWEFSSAVSPTSVGGSAVAFFVLAQEKLGTAKTATIVLYTIVLDTIFFVGTLPLLYALFGSNIIRPGMENLSGFDGWGYYFLFAYALMATYGSIFYYGLFISPIQMKRFLVGFTKIKFLKRFRAQAIEIGNDMIIASKEMKKQNWQYHIGAFLATATAWSCRFILLNCLIIAFVATIPLDFLTQFELYARLETMFVIVAFSPTPGGAGFVEILFNDFLSDYVTSSSSSTVIATLWRVLTYYSYLLIGVIIIPNWIKNMLNQRRK